MCDLLFFSFSFSIKWISYVSVFKSCSLLKVLLADLVFLWDDSLFSLNERHHGKFNLLSLVVKCPISLMLFFLSIFSMFNSFFGCRCNGSDNFLIFDKRFIGDLLISFLFGLFNLGLRDNKSCLVVSSFCKKLNSLILISSLCSCLSKFSF